MNSPYIKVIFVSLLILTACERLSLSLPTLPSTVAVPSMDASPTARPLPEATPSATPRPFPTPYLKSSPTPSLTPTEILLPTETITATGTPSADPNAPLVRIMPMGDSLTEGGYPLPAASYRGFLELMLKEAGYNVDFVGSQWKLAHQGTDYDHEGHGGFTIGPDESVLMGWHSNLADHLEYYLQKETDVILLLIGINDMFPTEDRPINPADAPGKLKDLVQRIRFLKPEARIFVASLAPTGWSDGSDWPDYMAVCQMAEKLGNADPGDSIYFVDLHGILEPLMDKNTDFVDGLHFSESGAEEVARVWFDALVSSGVLDGK